MKYFAINYLVEYSGMVQCVLFIEKCYSREEALGIALESAKEKYPGWEWKGANVLECPSE